MTFIDADQVEAHMAAALNGAGFTPTEPQPEPDPAPIPAPVEPEPPATLTLSDGRVISLEDAERWARFEPTLNDPRFIRAYQEAYREPSAPSAPVTPSAQSTPDAPGALSPDLAEELAVNPLAKVLWDRLQNVQSEQQNIVSQLGTIQNGLSLTEQRNAYSLINQARTNFAREKQLPAADLDRVYQAMVSVYDLDKLVSMPVNPLTGQAETPDPVKRLEDALNWTYNAFDEFRERDYTARAEAAKADSERKAKMSALSTSGSSAPPPTPTAAPGNEADRRTLLRDEIAALQSGTFINPE